MNKEKTPWSATDLPGLQVHRNPHGIVAMQLLGWADLLPLSVIHVIEQPPARVAEVCKVTHPGTPQSDRLVSSP
ncbi:hypothetical protein ACWDZ6_24450 [Streptomyces sp. NPDC002926]